MSPLLSQHVDASFDAIIVGGGPRAVATALRLRARLAAMESSHMVTANAETANAHAPLRLAIIDAIAVGPGATWRLDQPAEFLNNTQASATTVHPDDSTPMSGPAAPGPDLVDWARAVAEAGAHPAGEWVVEEARSLTPATFPTRRLQGAYFRDQLEAVETGGLVEITEVLGQVVDLVREEQGSAVVLADGRRFHAPTVVLAQGMVQAQRSRETQQLVDFAEKHHLRYIEPGMPAERSWTSLPPGTTVLVRGLGANFFDVIGHLVADWGGRTEPVPGDPHGRLRYLPSGREPHLLVGSRRGVPYRSKPDGGRFIAPFAPLWATPEWFATFRERSDVDFAADIWPTMAREFARTYLSSLAAYQPEFVREGWEDALEHAAQLEQIDEVLTAYIADPRWIWTLEQLHRPTGGIAVSSQEWDEQVAILIEQELGSLAEPQRHPRAAVNTAMGVLRRHVGRLTAAGAFHGRSLADDVFGWFDADSLALASGPPADRTRLVLALMEAGVIELIGPEAQFLAVEEAGLFRATSRITGRTATSTVLLETRMSKGKVPHTNDPLLRSLLDSGRARVHCVDGVATDSMEATPAEISEDAHRGHNLVDARGEVDPSVVVLGIPAQSTQPGSAIGATPGVPSPLLKGADIAAKQILARRARVRSGTAPAPRTLGTADGR